MRYYILLTAVMLVLTYALSSYRENEWNADGNEERVSKYRITENREYCKGNRCKTHRSQKSKTHNTAMLNVRNNMLRKMRRSKAYRTKIDSAMIIAEGKKRIKEQNENVDPRNHVEAEEIDWERAIAAEVEELTMYDDYHGANIREIDCGSKICKLTMVYGSKETMNDFIMNALPRWRWKIEDLGIPEDNKIERYSVQIEFRKMLEEESLLSKIGQS